MGVKSQAEYRMVSDRQQHEQEVVSLFGLFYGLLRGQLPWLAAIFENVISSVQLPRLDSNQLGEFSLPIGNTSIINLQVLLNANAGRCASLHTFAMLNKGK